MALWHIVGDSHTRSMQKASDQGLIHRPCTVTEVAGATAVGLRNPNARTDALNIFRQSLLPPDIDHVPVIHLGEVDCGFVIWYRAAKYAEPVDRQFNESLAAYFDFVDELLTGGYREVVVSGCTLPTIRDGQDWGEIANARREIRQSLVERTNLTLAYNQSLADGAARRGLPYIEITGGILNPVTCLVREDVRHPDPADHHLDPEKVAGLWAAELNRLSAETEKLHR